MARIAFVTTPDSFWGAQEAGLMTHFVAGPVELPDEMRRLAGAGFSLIVVTDDLIADGGAEARGILKAASPETTLLIAPGAHPSGSGYLEALRERFSVALGIDVWDGTAGKAGFDF